MLNFRDQNRKCKKNKPKNKGHILHASKTHTLHIELHIILNMHMI